MNDKKLTPTQQNAEDIKALDAKVDTILDAVGSLTEVLKASRAIDHPVQTTRSLDAQDLELGGASGSASFEDVPGEQTLNQPADFEVVPSISTEKARMMAFDNEMLEVFVEETSDENSDQVFEISVNGKSEFFRRGQSKRVKRMFVEGLLRAKPVTYRNDEIKDTKGLTQYKYTAMKGLRYPFHIVNPSARDERWARAIAAQP